MNANIGLYFIYFVQIDLSDPGTTLGEVSEFLKKDNYVVLVKKSGKT